MPAGDSLDKIINSRINDDLWQKMLGDMPCISTQEACIKQLQTLAVQNSRELKAIDERIEAIKTKIDESKANNQKSVRIGVFEPLLQSWLKTEDVKDSSGTVRKRGILDSIFGAITRPVSGINDIQEMIQAKNSLPQRLNEILPEEITCNNLLMSFLRGLIAPQPKQRFASAEHAELVDQGAAAFHRQLIKSDLASEYENDIRIWIDELFEMESDGLLGE